MHNGTIENCNEIKQELISKGIQFVSQTDTEVIVNLIGYYMDTLTNDEMRDICDGNADLIQCSLKKALSRLDGSWGIALIAKSEPDKIYAARNGSPLMIGLDPLQKRNFIASEHSAFVRYTNEYISLEDGEIAVISAENISILNKNKRIKKTPKNTDIVQTSPAPFAHWTIKEIYDEPESISRSLSYGSRLTYDNKSKLGGLEKQISMLKNIKHLIITACGSSYFAGMYGQKLMQYLNAFDTISTIDAAEITIDCIPKMETAAVGMLVISQSGETKDVILALNIADSLYIPRFSVVNIVGSLIANMTKLGVYTYAGREHGVASTKSFVSQITVLSLIAAWFAQLNENKSNKQRRYQLVNDLHRLSTYCGLTLDNCHSDIKRIASDIVLLNEQITNNSMFILGKGFAEPIAYEAALKVKELTYIHAEGFSGGALKHGPFALIEERTPVVMVILDDEHAKTMVTNAYEIEARGAYMIYVTDNRGLLAGLEQMHSVIEIPSNGCLTALLAVLPLQLLAYEIAVCKGINPDKPKNLAKAVTVV